MLKGLLLFHLCLLSLMSCIKKGLPEKPADTTNTPNTPSTPKSNDKDLKKLDGEGSESISVKVSDIVCKVGSGYNGDKPTVLSINLSTIGVGFRGQDKDGVLTGFFKPEKNCDVLTTLQASTLKGTLTWREAARSVDPSHGCRTYFTAKIAVEQFDSNGTKIELFNQNLPASCN